MKIKTVVFLFILIVGQPIHTEATFVKCAPPSGVKAEFNNATLVFLGKIISEEQTKLPKPISPSFDTAQVFHFQVERWWKGGTKANVDIHVMKMKLREGNYVFGPEQVNFQKDQSYLVYGFGVDGIIFASGCSRTKLSKYAQEDLRTLGQGKLPNATYSNFGMNVQDFQLPLASASGRWRRTKASAKILK